MTNNDREDKNMSETTTMPRFDLIDAEIEWAEAEEAKGEMSAWNQGEWGVDNAPCGTAYCIAGHVAAGAGWAPTTFEGGLDFIYLHRDGEEEEVAEIALEALQIDEFDNKYELFEASNTIDDLKRIRDNLAEHYGHPTKWR